MKLSIITVNLNNVEGLRQTAKSVVEQSYNDYEFIFIDGGSTDGSVEVIKQYEKYITYWITEPDTGIYNAMNKGIAVATGEYLLFLNSGDLLYEATTLEQLLDKLDDRCCIYYGNCHTESGCITAPENFNLREYIKGNWISHQSSFIPKILFNRYGSYDESYTIAADKKFFVLAASNKEKFKNLRQTICQFDTKGISNNLKYSEKKKLENVRIYEELFPRFRFFLIKKAVSFYRIMKVFKHFDIQIFANILTSKKNRIFKGIKSNQ